MRYLPERVAREREVSQHLLTTLAEYITLSDDVLEEVTGVLASFSKEGRLSDAAFVCTLLISRLLNDQRATVAMATQGYVLQALSVAAGMVELANATAFIGDDNKKAGRWLDHTDIKRTYPPDVVRSIRAACTMLELEETAVQREYGNYRHLCMAKHSNPIVMSQLGVQIDEGKFHVQVGPYVDDAVVRAARSAIASAARASWLAAMTLISYHVDAPHKEGRHGALAPLGAQMMALGERDKNL